MDNETLKQIKIVFIALIGGIAHYFDNWLLGHKFIISHFLASVFSSGFFGWLSSELTGQFNVGFQLFMAGISGYIGSNVAKIIVKLFGKKIGLEISNKDLEKIFNDNNEVKKDE